MTRIDVAVNIETLAAYEPGKPIEVLERELGITGAVKLASNEKPLGPSPRALAAARAALEGANRYPDGGGYRLRRALADRHGVGMDEIVLGAGSNEIIDLCVRVFCKTGEDEVLTHRHAFMMYGVSCQAHGVIMREADVTSELSCDVDALAEAVTPRTRLIFLPNPNNPTGTYVPRPALERLLDRLDPRILLVADEAYFEYARGHADYASAEGYRSPERPLIMTLRTFSKAYGMAAMRVGYGVADRAVVDYLNRVRLPFNVSTAAQEAALAALDDEEHVRRSVELCAAGMAQLHDGLARLPVRAYPSLANFILVDLGREAGPVYAELLRRGVIIRPMKAWGLPLHIRVSVGKREENERFLGALAEVILGLVGCGHIGGSLARALRGAGGVGRVVGHDRDARQAEEARGLGIIDDVATLPEVAAAADVIVLAVPVLSIPDCARRLAPTRAVVTDVGSTKVSVVRECEQALGPRFVGGHPMAGSELAGPSAARASLFEGKRVILTPTPRTDRAALEVVAAMWRSARATVVEMDAARHDRVVGMVSHLPHAVAYALVAAIGEMGEDLRGLTGGGFVDTTRIASTPPAMWVDVFVDNQELVLELLDRFTAQIEKLRGAIAGRDTAAIEALLLEAQRARARILS